MSAHKWKDTGSLQWGSMGLSPSAAASGYRCEKCGATFTHRYNIQPSIYKAMEEEGIDNNVCEPAKASA